MDFSTIDSECWESTPSQEKFIKSYFKKRKISENESIKESGIIDPSNSSVCLKTKGSAKKLKKKAKQSSLQSNAFQGAKTSAGFATMTEDVNRKLVCSPRNDSKGVSNIVVSESKNTVNTLLKNNGKGKGKLNNEYGFVYDNLNKNIKKLKKKKCTKQLLSLQNRKELLIASRESTFKGNFDETILQDLKKEQKMIGHDDKKDCEKVSDVKNSTSFRRKVQEKLQAAKFRYLNEKLYTESGKEAFNYFQNNVEEYEDYHVGYSLQVMKWPINPVDIIIKDLYKINENAVLADMGCGDAKIAQTFPARVVHSFDVISLNECVTACDISRVPLPNESVDVAIFCLSLMGTNLKDYLTEVHRVLKLGGTMKIAEVESRITDIEIFVRNLKEFGFALEKKDIQHKMFVFFDLKKVERKLKKSNLPSIILKACLYKKR